MTEVFHGKGDISMGAKISVIIPVYNGEKYVDAAVRSIIEQTFQDTQVIFVNDGSTDGTWELLQQYVKIYPDRILTINQENQGVSAARNTGLTHATGEYIAFVDVDDQLHPKYFEVLYKHIAGSDDKISVVPTTRSAEKANAENYTTQIRSGLTLLQDFLYGRVTRGVCGMLIPKRILDEYSLEFKKGYKYSEDLHMVWRLFCHAKEVVFISALLYIYLAVPNSAMTKINKNRFDSLYLMKDLEPYFAQHAPEFYPEFKQYGSARMAWSLLWQAAHYLDYKAFAEFTETYDFKSEIKKLKKYPDKRVVVSSACYLISKRIYHMAVSFITRKYRSK